MKKQQKLFYLAGQIGIQSGRKNLSGPAELDGGRKDYAFCVIPGQNVGRSMGRSEYSK
jgi:hypothetical protein